MERTSSSSSKQDGRKASHPRSSIRLLFYATGALVLMAAAALLNLDQTAYLVILLLVLGLAVRYFELHQRDAVSADAQARLNAELRQAVSEGEALREVSREISGHVRLGALLDLIAERARELLSADYASVATVDEETGGTAWMAVIGYRNEALKGLLLPPGQGLSGVAIARGRPVVVESFGTNPDFPAEQFPFNVAEGMVAGIAVPLTRGTEVLGALILGYRRERKFVEREIALLEAVAAQAAIAMENARLFEAERRKAAEMEAVIDNMNDGVVITDRWGKVLRCNRAAMEILGDVRQGERALDLRDRGAFDVELPDGRKLPPERWPIMQAPLREMFEGEDVIVRRSDGTSRHVSVDGRSVVDEKSRVVLGVTVMHDMTAASEMDRLKEEFLSLAAHELKTPLTSLKGYAQILQSVEDGRLGDSHRKALGVMVRQVDRINRMVEQFLRVAEIRSGRLALRPELVDLSAVAATACERVKRAANGCEVRCHAEEGVRVMADPRSLELAVHDLVHNAIKYSPAGEPVEVEVVRDGGDARVSVRDHGVGIPKEKQKHIFSPFYQVQPGTASQGGMGLSLYISRRLIEAQGGRMWMESSEGEGSVFRFSLPAAPPRE